MHSKNLQFTASHHSRNLYSALSQTLVSVLTVFSIRISLSSKLKFVSRKALFQSILLMHNLRLVENMLKYIIHTRTQLLNRD